VLRRQSDALTIELADGSELVTVGVIAAEGDRVMLSIDSTHAPNVQMAKEAVVATAEKLDTTCYLRSLPRIVGALQN
jgi:hypothetical protein